MINENKINLNDELKKELDERCKFLREISRDEIIINIETVDVTMFITIGEDEIVVNPIYVEEFSTDNELLVEFKGTFNGDFIQTKANLVATKEDIKEDFVSLPDEADINAELVENKKIKDEISWKKEMWALAKSLINWLVIQALKKILGISP